MAKLLALVPLFIKYRMKWNWAETECDISTQENQTFLQSRI